MGVDDLRFPIRSHAILRFWERWRPDLVEREDVIAEMARLMAEAKRTSSGPPWYFEPRTRSGFERGYLRASPSLMFCLAFYVGSGIQVSTVIVRRDKQKSQRGPTPAWVVELRRDRVDQVIYSMIRRARA